VIDSPPAGIGKSRGTSDLIGQPGRLSSTYPGPPSSCPMRPGGRQCGRGTRGHRMTVGGGGSGSYRPASDFPARRPAERGRHTSATACVVFTTCWRSATSLTRLRERGIRVAATQQRRCDDTSAPSLQPALTTITAPIEQTGGVAVSMLLARARRAIIAGKSAARRCLPDRTCRPRVRPAPHARTIIGGRWIGDLPGEEGIRIAAIPPQIGNGFSLRRYSNGQYGLSSFQSRSSTRDVTW